MVSTVFRYANDIEPGHRAHPPRKAPTGLRAGSGAASASRRDEVWKLRAGATAEKEAGDAAARDTVRMIIVLEAIVEEMKRRS